MKPEPDGKRYMYMYCSEVMLMGRDTCTCTEVMVETSVHITF